MLDAGWKQFIADFSPSPAPLSLCLCLSLTLFVSFSCSLFFYFEFNGRPFTNSLSKNNLEKGNQREYFLNEKSWVLTEGLLQERGAALKVAV